MTELMPGAAAPDFDLPSQTGKTIALSGLRGRWVVVYFYPRDSTPGCTREAHDFEAAKAKLAERGALVVGISKDSLASHQKFAAKCGLSFDLLADPTGATVEAYGAWGEKVLYGKRSLGIIRKTFLVDPKGAVRRAWHKVKVDGHADDVLAALDEELRR